MKSVYQRLLFYVVITLTLILFSPVIDEVSHNCLMLMTHLPTTHDNLQEIHFGNADSSLMALILKVKMAYIVMAMLLPLIFLRERLFL